jgi:hypothetical protein
MLKNISLKAPDELYLTQNERDELWGVDISDVSDGVVWGGDGGKVGDQKVVKKLHPLSNRVVMQQSVQNDDILEDIRPSNVLLQQFKVDDLNGIVLWFQNMQNVLENPQEYQKMLKKNDNDDNFKNDPKITQYLLHKQEKYESSLELWSDDVEIELYRQNGSFGGNNGAELNQKKINLKNIQKNDEKVNQEQIVGITRIRLDGKDSYLDNINQRLEKLQFLLAENGVEKNQQNQQKQQNFDQKMSPEMLITTLSETIDIFLSYYNHLKRINAGSSTGLTISMNNNDVSEFDDEEGVNQLVKNLEQKFEFKSDNSINTHSNTITDNILLQSRIYLSQQAQRLYLLRQYITGLEFDLDNYGSYNNNEQNNFNDEQNIKRYHNNTLPTPNTSQTQLSVYDHISAQNNSVSVQLYPKLSEREEKYFQSRHRQRFLRNFGEKALISLAIDGDISKYPDLYDINPWYFDSTDNDDNNNNDKKPHENKNLKKFSKLKFFHQPNYNTNIISASQSHTMSLPMLWRQLSHNYCRELDIHHYILYGLQPKGMNISVKNFGQNDDENFQKNQTDGVDIGDIDQRSDDTGLITREESHIRPYYRNGDRNVQRRDVFGTFSIQNDQKNAGKNQHFGNFDGFTTFDPLNELDVLNDINNDKDGQIVNKINILGAKKALLEQSNGIKFEKNNFFLDKISPKISPKIPPKNDPNFGDEDFKQTFSPNVSPQLPQLPQLGAELSEYYENQRKWIEQPYTSILTPVLSRIDPFENENQYVNTGIQQLLQLPKLSSILSPEMKNKIFPKLKNPSNSPLILNKKNNTFSTKTPNEVEFLQILHHLHQNDDIRTFLSPITLSEAEKMTDLTEKWYQIEFSLFSRLEKINFFDDYFEFFKDFIDLGVLAPNLQPKHMVDASKALFESFNQGDNDDFDANMDGVVDGKKYNGKNKTNVKTNVKKNVKNNAKNKEKNKNNLNKMFEQSKLIQNQIEINKQNNDIIIKHLFRQQFECCVRLYLELFNTSPPLIKKKTSTVANSEISSIFGTKIFQSDVPTSEFLRFLQHFDNVDNFNNFDEKDDLFNIVYEKLLEKVQDDIGGYLGLDRDGDGKKGKKNGQKVGPQSDEKDRNLDRNLGQKNDKNNNEDQSNELHNWDSGLSKRLSQYFDSQLPQNNPFNNLNQNNNQNDLNFLIPKNLEVFSDDEIDIQNSKKHKQKILFDHYQYQNKLQNHLRSRSYHDGNNNFDHIGTPPMPLLEHHTANYSMRKSTTTYRITPPFKDFRPFPPITSELPFLLQHPTTIVMFKWLLTLLVRTPQEEKIIAAYFNSKDEYDGLYNDLITSIPDDYDTRVELFGENGAGEFDLGRNVGGGGKKKAGKNNVGRNLNQNDIFMNQIDMNDTLLQEHQRTLSNSKLFDQNNDKNNNKLDFLLKAPNIEYENFKKKLKILNANSNLDQNNNKNLLKITDLRQAQVISINNGDDQYNNDNSNNIDGVLGHSDDIILKKNDKKNDKKKQKEQKKLNGQALFFPYDSYYENSPEVELGSHKKVLDGSNKSKEEKLYTLNQEYNILELHKHLMSLSKPIKKNISKPKKTPSIPQSGLDELLRSMNQLNKPINPYYVQLAIDVQNDPFTIVPKTAKKRPNKYLAQQQLPTNVPLTHSLTYKSINIKQKLMATVLRDVWEKLNRGKMLRNDIIDKNEKIISAEKINSETNLSTPPHTRQSSSQNRGKRVAEAQNQRFEALLQGKHRSDLSFVDNSGRLRKKKTVIKPLEKMIKSSVNFQHGLFYAKLHQNKLNSIRRDRQWGIRLAKMIEKVKGMGGGDGGDENHKNDKNNHNLDNTSSHNESNDSDHDKRIELRNEWIQYKTNLKKERINGKNLSKKKLIFGENVDNFEKKFEKNFKNSFDGIDDVQSSEYTEDIIDNVDNINVNGNDYVKNNVENNYEKIEHFSLKKRQKIINFGAKNELNLMKNPVMKLASKISGGDYSDGTNNVNQKNNQNIDLNYSYSSSSSTESMDFIEAEILPPLPSSGGNFGNDGHIKRHFSTQKLSKKMNLILIKKQTFSTKKGAVEKDKILKKTKIGRPKKSDTTHTDVDTSDGNGDIGSNNEIIPPIAAVSGRKKTIKAAKIDKIDKKTTTTNNTKSLKKDKNVLDLNTNDEIDSFDQNNKDIALDSEESNTEIRKDEIIQIGNKNNKIPEKTSKNTIPLVENDLLNTNIVDKTNMNELVSNDGQGVQNGEDIDQNNNDQNKNIEKNIDNSHNNELLTEISIPQSIIHISSDAPIPPHNYTPSSSQTIFELQKLKNQNEKIQQIQQIQQIDERNIKTNFQRKSLKTLRKEYNKINIQHRLYKLDLEEQLINQDLNRNNNNNIDQTDFNVTPPQSPISTLNPSEIQKNEKNQQTSTQNPTQIPQIPKTLTSVTLPPLQIPTIPLQSPRYNHNRIINDSLDEQLDSLHLSFVNQDFLAYISYPLSHPYKSLLLSHPNVFDIICNNSNVNTTQLRIDNYNKTNSTRPKQDIFFKSMLGHCDQSGSLPSHRHLRLSLVSSGVLSGTSISQNGSIHVGSGAHTYTLTPDPSHQYLLPPTSIHLPNQYKQEDLKCVPVGGDFERRVEVLRGGNHLPLYVTADLNSLLNKNGSSLRSTYVIDPVFNTLGRHGEGGSDFGVGGDGKGMKNVKSNNINNDEKNNKNENEEKNIIENTFTQLLPLAYRNNNTNKPIEALSLASIIEKRVTKSSILIREDIIKNALKKTQNYSFNLLQNFFNFEKNNFNFNFGQINNDDDDDDDDDQNDPNDYDIPMNGNNIVTNTTLINMINNYHQNDEFFNNQNLTTKNNHNFKSAIKNTHMYILTATDTDDHSLSYSSLLSELKSLKSPTVINIHNSNFNNDKNIDQNKIYDQNNDPKRELQKLPKNYKIVDNTNPIYTDYTLGLSRIVNNINNLNNNQKNPNTVITTPLTPLTISNHSLSQDLSKTLYSPLTKKSLDDRWGIKPALPDNVFKQNPRLTVLKLKEYHQTELLYYELLQRIGNGVDDGMDNVLTEKNKVDLSQKKKLDFSDENNNINTKHNNINLLTQFPHAIVGDFEPLVERSLFDKDHYGYEKDLKIGFNFDEKNNNEKNETFGQIENDEKVVSVGTVHTSTRDISKIKLNLTLLGKDLNTKLKDAVRKYENNKNDEKNNNSKMNYHHSHGNNTSTEPTRVIHIHTLPPMFSREELTQIFAKYGDQNDQNFEQNNKKNLINNVIIKMDNLPRPHFVQSDINNYINHNNLNRYYNHLNQFDENNKNNNNNSEEKNNIKKITAPNFAQNLPDLSHINSYTSPWFIVWNQLENYSTVLTSTKSSNYYNEVFSTKSIIKSLFNPSQSTTSSLLTFLPHGSMQGGDDNDDGGADRGLEGGDNGGDNVGNKDYRQHYRHNVESKLNKNEQDLHKSGYVDGDGKWVVLDQNERKNQANQKKEQIYKEILHYRSTARSAVGKSNWRDWIKAKNIKQRAEMDQMAKIYNEDLMKKKALIQKVLEKELLEKNEKILKAKKNAKKKSQKREEKLQQIELQKNYEADFGRSHYLRQSGSQPHSFGQSGGQARPYGQNTGQVNNNYNYNNRQNNQNYKGNYNKYKTPYDANLKVNPKH